MRSEKDIQERIEEMYRLMEPGTDSHAPIGMRVLPASRRPSALSPSDTFWEKYSREQPQEAEAYKEGYLSGELNALEWVLGGERRYFFQHP
jgi:hypothetical protein